MRQEHSPAGARCAELDGLRGLAAVMVVLSHYILAFQPALLGGGARVAHFAASVWIGSTPLIALYNPELGVAIFFTLSGFVLAASVSTRPAPFLVLAARRWLRLALPIFATSAPIWALIAAGQMQAVAAAPLAKSDWLAGNYAWIAFETNDPVRMAWQSFVDLFARGRDFYNPVLWTMPAEFWGSLAIYAAYVTLGRVLRAQLARIAVALLVLSFVWTTSYSGFACGVALFELRRLLVATPFPQRARIGACAGGILLTAGVILGGDPYTLDVAAGGFYVRLFMALSPLAENPVLLMHRMAAVALVAAALLSPTWRAVLRSAICRYLGRVSFMVYLCHVPLLCTLGAGLLLGLAPNVGYNAATLLILPLFLSAVMLVAECATRAFDAPAIRLSQAAGAALAPPWRVPIGARVRSPAQAT